MIEGLCWQSYNNNSIEYNRYVLLTQYKLSLNNRTCLDKHHFELKIVNVFLAISFNISFRCSKNRLTETVLSETVLLSAHN